MLDLDAMVQGIVDNEKTFSDSNWVLQVPFEEQKSLDAHYDQVAKDRAAGRKVAPAPRGVCDILVENCTFLNPRSYVFYSKNGGGFTLRGNKVEWRDPPCEKSPSAGLVHIAGEDDRQL